MERPDLRSDMDNKKLTLSNEVIYNKSNDMMGN